MHSVVYLDESGYTGSDYVNRDQPLFSLACNIFSREELEYVRSVVLAGDKGKELKLSRLLRRQSGREKLGKFIDYLGSEPEKYCCYVVHKRSALVRKFIDDCIEPVLYSAGINIYEDGCNLAYANLISSTLPVFMGVDWYEKFLVLYNGFIREKSQEALQCLWNHCCLAIGRKNVEDILSPFLLKPQFAYLEVVEKAYDSSIYDGILTALLVHLSTYFQINQAKVVYDSTKATSNESLSEFIGYVTHLGETFQISDVCTLHGDFSVIAVSAVDSIEQYGVQISDLIAGLFSYAFRSEERMESDIACHLREAITDKNFIHMINGTDVTPEALGLKGSQAPTLIDKINARFKTNYQK